VRPCQISSGVDLDRAACALGGAQGRSQLLNMLVGERRAAIGAGPAHRSVVLRPNTDRDAVRPTTQSDWCSIPDGAGGPRAYRPVMDTVQTYLHPSAPPAGTEERALMPRSSPRPAMRPGKGKDHLATTGPRRYGSNTSEREYSALAGQLDALEHDIDDAREASRRAAQPPGLTSHAEPEAPTPSRRGEPVALADGARILIRPIQPSDAQELNTGFEHLGAVSRYRRFLNPIDHLSDRQLAYLTHVDHISHEALVAIDAATGEGVAVARFVRDPGNPSRAEVAIAVADHWQGRGVGRALADRLSARASGAGVECFTARMLVGNHGGRRLLELVADEISRDENGGTVDFRARLRTSG
jgi:RimJ/RimL family protein N-acetyltransferase